MVKRNPPTPLSVKVRAVRALTLGASPKKTREAVGCGRTTLHSWKRDPDIQRRVAEGEFLEDGQQQIAANALPPPEPIDHEAERRAHNAAVKSAQDAAEAAAAPSVVVPLRSDEPSPGTGWSPIDDPFISAEFIQAVSLQLPLAHLAGIARMPTEVVESWFGWGPADGEGESLWGDHCRAALGRGVRDMHIKVMDGGQDGKMALQLLSARYPDEYNPRRSDPSSQASPLADFTDEQLDAILVAK